MRRLLPKNFPRETLIRVRGPERPDCGSALSKLSEDVAEVLEYLRSHLTVIRHLQNKHTCPACRRIVPVETPARPIARGLAGPGLLAHVRASKHRSLAAVPAEPEGCP